ncbi:hypothetical protein E2986_10742 [Frieseomelitta varia]|uniref:Uncharacterized protein n=1 Tax=Frieseomelitta varia TaxID=561572 RepID=A0A833W1C8_9HYME|nr:hypothetical protein E2986_10742 [Frieseomelitta varia]
MLIKVSKAESCFARSYNILMLLSIFFNPGLPTWGSSAGENMVAEIVAPHSGLKMLEEIASSCMIGLCSFLEIFQFTPKVPNLWDKETFNVQPINDTRIKRSDVLLGYLIMFWVVLYFMYEKCLNSLLRRMRIPLMQRNRIIKAVWECGFCFGSICYLKSPNIKILSFFTGGREVIHEELGVILHKSFYFHRAGIEILYHGAWIKGWVNLLFVSFIMNPYQEKWCTVVSTFLFYKAIDTIIINICRILLCASHNAGRKLSKLFFYLHCLSWSDLLICIIRAKVDVMAGKYGTHKSTAWLVAVVHSRLTKHQKGLNFGRLCSVSAMAIKKKIKKIRQTKENDSMSEDNFIEGKLIETERTKEITEEQKDEIIKQYNQIENE